MTSIDAFPPGLVLILGAFLLPFLGLGVIPLAKERQRGIPRLSAHDRL